MKTSKKLSHLYLQTLPSLHLKMRSSQRAILTITLHWTRLMIFYRINILSKQWDWIELSARIFRETSKTWKEENQFNLESQWEASWTNRSQMYLYSQAKSHLRIQSKTRSPFNRIWMNTSIAYMIWLTTPSSLSLLFKNLIRRKTGWQSKCAWIPLMSRRPTEQSRISLAKFK